MVAAGTATGIGPHLAFWSVAGSSLYLASSEGFRVTVGVVRVLGVINSAIGSRARSSAAPVIPSGACTIGRLFSRVFVFVTNPHPSATGSASLVVVGVEEVVASDPPTVVEEGSGVRCRGGGGCLA